MSKSHSSWILSVSRVIEAPPERIFEWLADADRHPIIDGSGLLREARAGGGTPLRLGSTFSMAMRAGAPYTMVSTVIEFEPNRRIAWQSHPPGQLGRFIGGRIWRYELEPVSSDRTRVTESWDLTQDHQRALLRLCEPILHTRGNMGRTLARLAELATS